MKHWYVLLILLLIVTGATAQDGPTPPPDGYYLGVDLSYVNEMDDCGAIYRVNGEPRDPYQIFADYGANLVRVRLWVNPDWTTYSTFDDVVRSLQRATALHMHTLLDFHYSDTWADPSKQIIPAEWADITDTDTLAQTLYQYTYDTLTQLDSLGLMPDIVQTGNEINTEILRPENASGYPIDWARNATLLNAAIRAVRDAGAQGSKAPRVMLHIAKPEEVEGWMLAAERAGVTDFDIIGISYYVGWSRHTLNTVGGVINQLRYRFGKDVLIAETGYPWTLDAVPESAGNILDSSFLTDGYPASPDGQRQFLIDLTQTVFDAGGIGIVYWEPAWVSTSCRTLWGQGSHWENATFFDFHNNNEVLPGIEFLGYPYTYPVAVSLRFAPDSEPPAQIYFWGDFTGMGRRSVALTAGDDGRFTLQARLLPGTEIQYQFYSALPASPETALVPADCLNADGYATATIDDSAMTITASADACPVTGP